MNDINSMRMRLVEDDETTGGVSADARGQRRALPADPMVVTAILDRMLHHSHVLVIRGE